MITIIISSSSSSSSSTGQGQTNYLNKSLKDLNIDIKTNKCISYII